MPYKNGNIYEGRICLFDSHTNSAKQITKFTEHYDPFNVATTKDKVDYFLFGISNFVNFRFSQLDLITNRLKFLTWVLNKSLEVILQKPVDWLNFIAFFAGPDPPEWRRDASVAYFKNKLYYWADGIVKHGKIRIELM